jgi:uncharacterized tellurite resistance protein B-like protein
VGLFDRLRAQREPQPEPVFEFTVTIGDRDSRFSIPIGGDSDLIEADRGPTQTPAECWVPAGQEVEVGGQTIDKGLIYLGRNLPAADHGYLLEPSLVNPELEARPPSAAADPPPHYWPSFEALSAEQRGGYLNWLAGPRRSGEASQAHLFIYFYALERRLLFDPRTDAGAAGERATLVGELERLGAEASEEDGHGAFARHLEGLLEFIEAQDLLAGRSRATPPSEQVGWAVPMTLRLMVGEVAEAGLPLPGELALSWVRTSPEARLRTPAQRCAREFGELFKIRYRERFGGGLDLPGGKELFLHYRTSSQGLTEVSEPTGLPDVVDSNSLIGPLRELAGECSTELDPLSRWLGRNPDDAGNFKASSLLPRPLLGSASSPELDRLRSALERISSGDPPWTFDLAELIELWSPGAEKLPKKEAVMVAQLLEGLGFGLEPDQRFGGLAPKPGIKAVLFEAKEGDPHAPSAAYAAASLLLHLMAAVAAADGSVSREEEELLESHIHGVEELYEGERTRLHAHAVWLTLNPPKLGSLRKKLEPLSDEQREGIGQGLLTLAAADGNIAPEEVKILSKVFGLLDLDPESVYAGLHAASQGDGPVVVRQGAPGIPGHPIPAERGDSPQGLDREAIDRKLEETATVSSLLTTIFADDEEGGVTEAPLPATQGTAGSLSGENLELARSLSKRESWSRAEVEALAAERAMMVDGALEAINDAAFESCDAPLLEGEDPIEVDPEVAKEMFG